MANIPENTFRNWKNNETIHANEYTKEREMLRVAINDNDERLDGLELGANNLRLDDNFAIPGTGAGTYPLGLSTFRVIASSDWPVSDGFVLTNRSSDGEATQTVSSLGPNPKILFRNTSSGTWSAFSTTETVTSVDKKVSDAKTEVHSEINAYVNKELWKGALYVLDTQTIPVSKKLSECRNGWILVWSDYDPSPTSQENNYDFVFSYVPKVFTSLHSGARCFFQVPAYMSTSELKTIVKGVKVYDDKLIGYAENNNNTTGTSDVVLRYVLEY